MFRDFVSREIETNVSTVFVRSSGSGPPLLLLHGFPETHLMWRDVAPVLAQDFTVVCADLPGYGQSGCPASTPRHTSHSKRAMAQQMSQVMSRLGFERFSVAGHDRGGRVAYRLALDHPDRIDKLAVLDVLPVEIVWERADARFALVPLPQSIANMTKQTAPPGAARRRIACSVLVLWSANGALDQWYEAEGGSLQLWRSLANDVQGRAVKAGHFFPEECSEETAQAFRTCFKVEPPA
jgi:haloacetate dehalogenase